MKATDPYATLSDQARDVFRQVVEHYIQTGVPVGSRTLSPYFGKSPAWIRNFMADLEDMQLITAPHTSAGRIPTLKGLRLFIDGFMEAKLDEGDRRLLEEYQKSSPPDMYGEASRLLSDLSHSAGLVVTGKGDKAIRNIQFVSLSPAKAMVILVAEDSSVENRVMDVSPGITPDILDRASNFLSDKLRGKTMREMSRLLEEDISIRKGELGDLLRKVESEGIAFTAASDLLVVRGASNLLNQDAVHDIERIRLLMEQLEAKEAASKILEHAVRADGVKIFLGSENPVFQSSTHSMILTPYRDGTGTMIGAVGVIGPTYLNYAKIVPSVNFMAEIMTGNIGKLSEP